MSERKDPPALTRGDGVVSRLLHSEENAPDTELTVTWVEVEQGSEQVTHSHQPEQVYVVVSGEGRMRVGGSQRDVSAGDCVHIPSNAEHGIENTGEDKLEYVSAATPSFPREQIDEFYRSHDS
jgi:mannose-6-phosphate isomerase-like protein (cupin superfamily)